MTNLFPPMHTQNSLLPVTSHASLPVTSPASLPVTSPASLPVTSQLTNLPLPNFPTRRREQSMGIFRAVKYLVHPLVVIEVSFVTLFIIITFILVHIRCQRYH